MSDLFYYLIILFVGDGIYWLFKKPKEKADLDVEETVNRLGKLAQTPKIILPIIYFVWMFAGLWSDERFLFFVLILSTFSISSVRGFRMMVYRKSYTPSQMRKQAIVEGIFQIIIMSIIYYIHFYGRL